MSVTPRILNVKADTSTRLTNLEITGTLEVDGALDVAGALDVTGQITASAGVLNPQQVMDAETVITVRNGSVVIIKATAATLTLAAPTAAQAGTVITVLSTTAAAHTITAAINAAGTTATFGAAALNRVTLLAYNLRWWVIDSLNVTIS